MRIQKGGYLLETEEAFFEWLNQDKNIEDLLKSTVKFMEYKKSVADSLVANNMKELNSFWESKLISRIQTDKTVKNSFNEAYIKMEKTYSKEVDLLSKVYSTGTSAMSTNQNQSSKEVGDALIKLSAGINNIQQLKTLYNARIKEICDKYFAKKGNPEEYKKALDEKRKSIRTKVNMFIESFTGESNRRHRLYILNYAIDFAQNWTSFQANYKLNLLITGGAGLGKTTFAKAIGLIFYEFGFLAKDVFKIREKTDFIGRYLGETPNKTYEVLYDSLESMIFIDEAYSVSGCGETSGVDYGQEFIDALVDISQKTRGLISVVAAGYKAEMHSCFLDKNPGMRRRFPNEIELTPYSIIDLDNILSNAVLRPIFSTQLNTVLKMDLMKEPEIYFTNAAKFREFGKEIINRLPEIDPNRTLGEQIYVNLLSDENRAKALQEIAKKSITDYSTVHRYRTKIIGMYRFFLQLASFDTNYSSFEAMYSAHQFFWKILTENDTTRNYKYNNYRLLHLIYMCSNQQRREILKSYILRKYFSEKEGSLFPNQAGDMDTIAAFIKSQPNLRNNVLPTFEEVTKLFNEYFRSRGGSTFHLRAQKSGETGIDLYIYHVGGGFVGYNDFEQSVITKILESLTYDDKDVSAIWKLNAQTPEHRQKIIQKVNEFYTNACTSLLQDANDALKSNNSKEKNEKRLPSGIDIRFLEAEVNNYRSMNRGEELGSDEQRKYLEYVSFVDASDDTSGSAELLSQITKETSTNAAPISLTLDEVALCRDFVDLSKIALPKATATATVPPPVQQAPPKPTQTEVLVAAKPKGVPSLTETKTAPPPAGTTTTAAPVDTEPKPPQNIYVVLEKGARAIFNPDSVINLSKGVTPTGYTIAKRLPPLKKVWDEKKETHLYEVYKNDKPDDKLVYFWFLTPRCFELRFEKQTGFMEDKRFGKLTYIGKKKDLYPTLKFPMTFRLKSATAPPPPPPPTTTTTKSSDATVKEKYKKALTNLYPSMPPTDEDVLEYVKLSFSKAPDAKGKLSFFIKDYIFLRAKDAIEKSGNGDIFDPETLYYKGDPIDSDKWSAFKGQLLTCSPSYPGLTVAQVVDRHPDTVFTDYKGNQQDVILYKVILLYDEDGVADYTKSVYKDFGIVLDDKNKTSPRELSKNVITFQPFEDDDDDEDENNENDESKEE